MVSWKDVKVGDRALIADNVFRMNIHEVEIREFSPSRRYVKVRYIPRNSYEWIDTEEYDVLEVM